MHFGGVMANGKQIGYIRVNEFDQNSIQQLQEIEIDKIFKDTCSGKTANRPQLQACLEYISKGDVLHIHSLDRLARNVEDLFYIVRNLTERDITVFFHKENLIFFPDKDSNSFVSRQMLAMLGAIVEFEKSLFFERQREGISLAKKLGKYKGRPSTITDEIRADIKHSKEMGVTIAAIARKYSRSRKWVYSALQE